MSNLKKELIKGVGAIVGKEVAWDENLYTGAVDSMSLVEIINLVEKLATENSVNVNYDALISEEVLTLNDIYRALSVKGEGGG